MNNLLTLLILIGVGAAIAKHLKSKSSKLDAASYSRRNLLSATEREFYQALKHAVRPDHQIFAQVRLQDVIDSKEKLNWKKRLAEQSRVQRKSVDFLICDAITTAPLCVIEVNDKTHNQPERQRRDRFVGEALQSAGIKILWVTAASRYSTETIRAQLRGMGMMMTEQRTPPGAS